MKSTICRVVCEALYQYSLLEVFGIVGKNEVFRSGMRSINAAPG